jgi:hypothetical protein
VNVAVTVGGTTSAPQTFTFWQQTAPVQVNSTVNGLLTGCSTANSNTGRKLSADGNADVYAGMICNGSAYVAESNDSGQTFAQAVAIGMDNLAELAVQGGPGSTVYVGGLDNDGNLLFAVSGNAGATWTTPVTLDTNASTFSGLSLNTYGSIVYVEDAASAGGVNVFANATQGVGSFTAANAANQIVFGAVQVDQSNGNVWVTTDTPQFHVCESTNGGQSFGAVTDLDPSIGSYFSNWTYGGGNIYAAGSSSTNVNNTLWTLPAANPTTATGVTIMESQGSQQMSISADVLGNVFVATQDDNGAVGLQQYTIANGQVSAERVVAPAGSEPGVMAVVPNVALLIYTDENNNVLISTQLFQ